MELFCESFTAAARPIDFFALFYYFFWLAGIGIFLSFRFHKREKLWYNKHKNGGNP